MGNGGYTSLHTDLYLDYDAIANQFLPGTHADLQVRSTQCLSDLSFDFEQTNGHTADGSGPNMAVNSVEVDDGGSFKQHKVAKANYKCAEQNKNHDSGIASCVGDVPKGSPIDTSTLGDHTFTVTGTDVAGNVTTKTVHYSGVAASHGYGLHARFFRYFR